MLYYVYSHRLSSGLLAVATGDNNGVEVRIVLKFEMILNKVNQQNLSRTFKLNFRTQQKVPLIGRTSINTIF